MAVPNTRRSLAQDLEHAGLATGQTVIVHSSLSKIGYTVGGAATVVQALLDVLGPAGTLVMPAESPQLEDPSFWNDPRVEESWHVVIREHLPVFDRQTTPTTMGAIAEAFRRWPGTLRSDHPTVSVCARGPRAEEVTKDHPLAFCEGQGSPFEKLHQLDAQVLLLGVGFDRCTLLHFAESLTPGRRTSTSKLLVDVNGSRTWLEVDNMAIDGGALFPAAGEAYVKTIGLEPCRIGKASSWLFRAGQFVDIARQFLEQRQSRSKPDG